MTLSKNSNIIWEISAVTQQKREQKNGHRGAVIWFTGLSGAGKSSLAKAVEYELYNLGLKTFLLDGDNIRHGLCSDLSFSNQDRTENIRRVGEVSKMFMEAGLIVLVAFISPIRKDRDNVRYIVESREFYEIYCKAPLEVCESRDVKGLYKLAREGKIKEFTGISSPYQPPLDPELTIETDKMSLDDSVSKVLNYIKVKIDFGGLSYISKASIKDIN